MSNLIRKYVLGLLSGKELEDFEAQLAQNQELQEMVDFYRSKPNPQDFFEKADQKLESALSELSKKNSKPSLQDINRYKRQEMSVKEKIDFENKMLKNPALWNNIVLEKPRTIVKWVAAACVIICLPIIGYLLGKQTTEEKDFLVEIPKKIENTQIGEAKELATQNKEDDSVSMDYFADYFRKASDPNNGKERALQTAKIKKIVDFSNNDYEVYKIVGKKQIFVRKIRLTDYLQDFRKENYNQGLYTDEQRPPSPSQRFYKISPTNPNEASINLGYIKATVIKNKLQIDTIKILVEKDTLLLFPKKQAQ